jgi:hypothetical protein
MIPNHAEFLAAIHDHKKVWLRYYSTPDSGLLDRVCAPMNYGPRDEIQDELNRYWLWDYASSTGSHTLGLLPQQIVELRVLGDVFDPAQFTSGTTPAPTAPAVDPVPAGAIPSVSAKVPIL